ncbi:MAG: endonuclease [Lachnospiraceae bacterium]|nr:endonuclease [Lachnospiraceae bacterium]
MLNYVKKSLSVFLILVLFFARMPGASENVSAAAPSPSNIPKNTATRHEVCKTLSTQARAYYPSGSSYEDLILLDGTKTTDSTKAIGSPLFNRLQEMMQIKESITYKKLPEYWVRTDANEGSDEVWLFYDDFEATSSTSYDREHVWPKSHGNFVESGAGADIHHLRPTIRLTNSTRGNMTMGDVLSKNLSGVKTITSGPNDRVVAWYVPSTAYSVDGADGLVEVLDEVKGDVARIYLYVYVTYGSAQSNKNLFTTCDAYGANDNDGMKVMESLATLLRWMAIDPVDEWEMRRNDLCELVQGNRNIFIDYPELAWYLFDLEEQMPEMQTPSGHANGLGDDYVIEAVSSDPEKGTVSLDGQIITAYPKEGFRTAGYEIVEGSADVTRNENVFHVTPHSNCVIKILFEDKAKVTLTYRVNGALYGTEEVYQGDPADLPSAIPAPEGWTFAGWVTESIERTDEKPSAIYTNAFPAESDTTLYALFTQEEEGGGTGDWTKLTSLDVLEAGTKVVFACQQYNTVAGALVSDKYLTSVACSAFSNNMITALPAAATVFTLGGQSGAWTFTSSNGVLYCNGKTSLNYSGTGIPTWTIALNSGNTVVASTTTGYGMIEYNASSSPKRFTTYLESSNQKKIQIYYLTEGNTVYYSTEPDPHVYELPKITWESGPLTAGEGKEARFSVTAEGEELAYQWLVSQDNGASFAAVSEASGKTASYAFTAAAAQNGWLYCCEVSNPAGAVRSKAMKLTVVTAPEILRQPRSVNAALRKMVSFSVTASGGGLSYRWYVSKDNGKTFSAITEVSGRTSKYCLRVDNASYNGYLYRCVVTNLAGEAVSQTVKLTVTVGGGAVRGLF